MTQYSRLRVWLDELGRYRTVALDTSVVIYYVERNPRYFGLVSRLVNLIHRGSLLATVSVIVEAETLVQPTRLGESDTVNAYRRFFRDDNNLSVRDAIRPITREAARIRAETGLQLADSIIVATAQRYDCDALIGNDAQMIGHDFGLAYLHLDNYIS